MTQTVQLMATCLIDSLFPEVGEAVIDVLRQAGLQVHFPRAQTCCGQPAFNAGFGPQARAMATRTIDVFSESSDPVIVPSGSCAAMLRHGYLELFRDSPAQLARAQGLADRTYELSEYLVDIGGGLPSNSLSVGRAVYHPSCHLMRGLGVDRQPMALLGASVGRLSEECCGFGGVFSVEQPELSTEMLARKLAEIFSSGADIVVAGDVSCLMHIEGGLRKVGSAVRCAHLAQVLAGRPAGLR
ncbi:MAG TPA: (Fe-S)-binding protein [Anaerolineales bacterium]|nr:(Fe-S)-binding protein [Anaerolineales bacterium]